jgi:membrane glycosyltransferase
MLKPVQRAQGLPTTLLMPRQDLSRPFQDVLAPDLSNQEKPYIARLALLTWPVLFSLAIAIGLATVFYSDSKLTLSEIMLIMLMALLAGWEAIPGANAMIGLFAKQKSRPTPSATNLRIAILATIRDEKARDVITGKITLLQSLQHHRRHSFALHVLSDSSDSSQILEEQDLVMAALPLPVFHHHRSINVDFKSGNIRNWIVQWGADYDAFIILDADSELDSRTAISLADAMAADPNCGLIQTIPIVLPGHTRWQNMQSIASSTYGNLQGQGMAAWMGNEANYYGHNAIIRTKAFAACAGLPHLEGHGLWNGPILSHDFVEAALLRRAGWAVQLMPSLSESSEQAPTDIIAYLKRDARWCLGNFQHGRILRAAGLHHLSRFHLINGILSYVSSAVWLTTLMLWALVGGAQNGAGAHAAAFVFGLIATNLLLPRILGVVQSARKNAGSGWKIVKAAFVETLFSSLAAPSLMLQRVKIIIGVLANRKLTWPPLEKAKRGLWDYWSFHWLEVLSALGLFAMVERGFLTPWFLPLALCLSVTPLSSWYGAQSRIEENTKN